MEVPPAITAIAPDGQLSPAQRRRFMIDFCRRRMKPGTGSAASFLNRRTAMHPWPDLRPILSGIPWAIVEGVATRAYMPERATKDLDVLVTERDHEAALAALRGAGYELVAPLTVPGALLRSTEGVEVDLLWGSDPWVEEALAQPYRDPAGYPVLDLPYLILMKLDASRAIDFGDLTRMLGLAADEELGRVRTVIARHMPDASEDLESLIYLGKLEMGDAR